MQDGFYPLTLSIHNITTYGEALWKERVWVSNVVCPTFIDVVCPTLLTSRAEQTRVKGLDLTMGGQGPLHKI